MSNDIGPGLERTALTEDVVEEFHAVMGALAEGALVFPSPFDASSTVALGRNFCRGERAVTVFETERATLTNRYRIQISEEFDDEPLRREVMNVAHDDPRILIGMILSFVQELTGALHHAADQHNATEE